MYVCVCHCVCVCARARGHICTCQESNTLTGKCSSVCCVCIYTGSKLHWFLSVCCMCRHTGRHLHWNTYQYSITLRCLLHAHIPGVKYAEVFIACTHTSSHYTEVFIVCTHTSRHYTKVFIACTHTSSHYTKVFIACTHTSSHYTKVFIACTHTGSHYTDWTASVLVVAGTSPQQRATGAGKSTDWNPPFHHRLHATQKLHQAQAQVNQVPVERASERVSERESGPLAATGGLQCPDSESCMEASAKCCGCLLNEASSDAMFRREEHGMQLQRG